MKLYQRLSIVYTRIRFYTDMRSKAPILQQTFCKKAGEMVQTQRNNGENVFRPTMDLNLLTAFLQQKRQKTLFENTLSQLGIEHKLISSIYAQSTMAKSRAQSPRRSQQILFVPAPLGLFLRRLKRAAPAARLSRTNNRPMRPLKWFSLIEFLNNGVNMIDKPTPWLAGNIFTIFFHIVHINII